MGKNNIWMPLYLGDYLADTAGLSTELHGAYLLLIMAYWNNRGPLPDDDAELARITRLAPEAWQKLRPRIAKFFHLGALPDKPEVILWKHTRIDKELERAIKISASRSEAGRKAARARHAGASRTGEAALRHAPSQSQSHRELGVKRELPVELPGGFPKTEAEALSHAMACGVPKEFVLHTWHKALGRGGRDGRDIPIRHWAGHVKTEWKYEQERRAKHEKGNSKTAPARGQDTRDHARGF